MGFELQIPRVEPGELHDVALWAGETFDVVPLDVPGTTNARIFKCGVVERFEDPFTVWEIQHPGGVAWVTVYASNYDGALCKGVATPALREEIAGRYGIHRWSDVAWKETHSGA